MKKIIVLVSGLVASMHISLGMQSPLLEKFAQKYAPPEQVVKFIEQNKKRVMSLYSGEWVHARGSAFGYIPECPDVYFKGMSVERLINAERMRRCIEKYGLNLVGVARKYIYNIDGTWIVMADYVQSLSDHYAITLQEFKDLYTLAQKTAYWDFNWNEGPNWLRDQHGRLICCDTDDNAFCKDRSSCAWVYHYMYDQLWKNTELFGEGVLSYAEQQKKELAYDHEYITPLHTTMQYDDPGMDFEEVKRLLRG